MNFLGEEKFLPSIAMRRWAKHYGLQFEFTPISFPYFISGDANGVIWGHVNDEPVFVFVMRSQRSYLDNYGILLTFYNGNFYKGFSYDLLEKIHQKSNTLDVQDANYSLKDDPLMSKNKGFCDVLGKTYRSYFSEITYIIMGNYYLHYNVKLSLSEVCQFHKMLLSLYFSYNNIFVRIVYYVGIMRGLIPKQFFDTHRNEIISKLSKEFSDMNIVMALLSEYEYLYEKDSMK